MERKCIVCGKIYTNPGRRCNGCRNKQWKLNNPEKDLRQRREYNKRRWQKIKPIHTENKCVECGKVFMPNKFTPYQLYCKPECRVANFKRNHREDILRWHREEKKRHSARYKEWNDAYKDKIRFGGNRKKTLVRDDYKCQLCKSQIGLVVHHIDGTGQEKTANQELKNLQTLCRSCHARYHHCNN